MGGLAIIFNLSLWIQWKAITACTEKVNPHTVKYTNLLRS